MYLQCQAKTLGHLLEEEQPQVRVVLYQAVEVRPLDCPDTGIPLRREVLRELLTQQQLLQAQDCRSLNTRHRPCIVALRWAEWLQQGGSVMGDHIASF